ncbi:MAG: ferredoxin family protein [Clostridia bacterium]|nr:4Fe-4S dicluster domain-containing protein [Clostridiales bacterium]
MGYFNKTQRDPLELVTIIPDEKPHIFIKKDSVCIKECENKPCTFYCPSRVYYWEDDSIKVLYERCIECGACPYGCPYDNIAWQFPGGGFGVVY